MYYLRLCFVIFPFVLLSCGSNGSPVGRDLGPTDAGQQENDSQIRADTSADIEEQNDVTNGRDMSERDKDQGANDTDSDTGITPTRDMNTDTSPDTSPDMMADSNGDDVPNSNDTGSLPTAVNILFVGNSYLAYGSQVSTQTTVIDQFLSLADEANIQVTHTRSIIGGGTLQQHWNDTSGINANDELATGAYDLMILQGRFSLTAQTDINQFNTHADLLTNVANANNTAHLFYGLWAADYQISYSNGVTVDTWGPNAHMIYSTAANRNGSGYSPSGLAYAEAYQSISMSGRDAEIVLTADTVHPTNLGAYLAACTLFSSVFRVPAPTVYAPAGVSAADALLARNIAWSVSQQQGLALPVDWYR